MAFLFNVYLCPNSGVFIDLFLSEKFHSLLVKSELEFSYMRLFFSILLMFWVPYIDGYNMSILHIGSFSEIVLFILWLELIMLLELESWLSFSYVEKFVKSNYLVKFEASIGSKVIDLLLTLLFICPVISWRSSLSRKSRYFDFLNSLFMSIVQFLRYKSYISFSTLSSF